MKVVKLKLLGLTQENERFADLLTSDYCARIVKENKLAIHIDTGNIYFDDFNISFYHFIVAQ